MADLDINDDQLEYAGALLVLASNTMVTDNTSIPSGSLESLTGIGSEVRRFLNGLQTGRLALADAAKTSGEEVAGVMKDSSELDAFIASDLYSGFAVKGSAK